MTIHQVLVDSDEQPGHWYTALRYLRDVEDWPYLVRRAHQLAPRKVLALLLYATEVGIPVPASTLSELRSEGL